MNNSYFEMMMDDGWWISAIANAKFENFPVYPDQPVCIFARCDSFICWIKLNAYAQTDKLLQRVKV